MRRRVWFLGVIAGTLLLGAAGAARSDTIDSGAFELQDTPQSGASFTVNTTADHDDGVCGTADCTLREAINASNGAAGANAITFAANVIGTITLTGGELAITDTLRITGPGARNLSVDGNLAGRVFRIEPPGAAVTISDLTITRGQNTTSGADSQGGGIYNTANLTLANCTLSNNSALGGSLSGTTYFGVGGGIYNKGALTMTGCTVTGNLAQGGTPPLKGTSGANGNAGFGGGIYNAANVSTATITLQNCTLSGNIAQGGAGGRNIIGGKGGDGSSGEGGAIYAQTGILTITNSTVTGNAARGGAGGSGSPSGSPGEEVGGGVVGRIFGNPLDPIGNTIIAGNIATSRAPDVDGVVKSSGHNLIGNGDPNGSTNFSATGDKVGTTARPIDAKTDVLANNGGPTDTIALLVGSPAINAGDDTMAPSTDQRGASRVGVSDIGAFEFGGSVPTPTTLANISTRLLVETGDNVLIGGFIVTGTQSKKVIVRAIGPSLSSADHLADPILELHGSSGALLDSNDNWQDSPNKQAIIDSTIPPTNALESAIVATLPANNSAYTAIVRGVNNGTGTGVVEVYDLDTSANSKLANISTRGLVQTGDNVLIAGTIVVGQASQKVIIRALGPSVPVAGHMADPTLELRDVNGALLEANDNWVDSPNKQAIIDSTIPPTNNLESAIVRTLAPASYTAIVRGAGNTTGIAVVEVYALN